MLKEPGTDSQGSVEKGTRSEAPSFLSLWEDGAGWFALGQGAPKAPQLVFMDQQGGTRANKAGWRWDIMFFICLPHVEYIW